MNTALTVSIVMFSLLFIMLAMGTPIAISIGVSSVVPMFLVLPFNGVMTTSAQRLFVGIDSFSLLAIPFFILAGNIMNNGGIAIRLVNCAKLFAGRLPGSLAETNIVSNMLFGSISGSGVAAAAAIGGAMSSIEEKEGYDKAFSAAVNIASAPTGMLIPPSNTLIVYSTIAGSVSISALFMAGYLPGILWGLAVMVITGFMAKKRGYVIKHKFSFKEAVKIIIDAIPSLLLIVIIIGGILKGVFTATEGSAVAVVYSFILSLIYKSLKLKDMPDILLRSTKMTAVVVFMIGLSSIMSWLMAFTKIPDVIASILLSISSNKIIVLLIMNLLLIVVGAFMDPVPAILIFTPIFLPICSSFGMHTVHFGIMIVLNLCIGTITPPVGPILFTGCKVGNVTIEEVIKTLLPFFATTVVILMLVTYLPSISMVIPNLLGLIK